MKTSKRPSQPASANQPEPSTVSVFITSPPTLTQTTTTYRAERSKCFPGLWLVVRERDGIPVVIADVDRLDTANNVVLEFKHLAKVLGCVERP